MHLHKKIAKVVAAVINAASKTTTGERTVANSSRSSCALSTKIV